MATKKVFAVYDVKSEIFGAPIFLQSKGEAIRAFSDVANNDQSPICRYAGDFKLVYLGLYDEETGQFENSQQETLGFASDFKNLGNAIPLGVVKGA